MYYMYWWKLSPLQSRNYNYTIDETKIDKRPRTWANLHVDKRQISLLVASLSKLVKRQGYIVTQSLKADSLQSDGIFLPVISRCDNISPWVDTNKRYPTRHIRTYIRKAIFSCFSVNDINVYPEVYLKKKKNTFLILLQNYLAQYGYLPPINPEIGAFLSEEKLKAAIEEFQAFAGLNITGMLNIIYA